jgi:hypothetical protein
MAILAMRSYHQADSTKMSYDTGICQDAPLISVGDPANACSWEWSSGIDRCFCCIGANNYFNHMIIESPYLPDLSVPQFELQALNESCRDAMDPFQLVEKDVKTLSGGIKDLLGSDHPVLESCAK